MSEKMVKVKNISRNDFGVSLNFVTENKHVNLKPGVVLPLTADEYTYLSTQCPGAFTKGFLQVVEIDPSLESEKIESENVASVSDIEKMLELTLPKFKKEISEVECVSLLRDIRTKAIEMDKSERFMEEIDAQITKFAGGSILL